MAIRYAGDLAYYTHGVFTDEVVSSSPEYIAGDTLDDTPANILAQYIVQITELMVAPSAEAVWPLYVHRLPDGNAVPSNAGAVIDTTPVKDGRIMGGNTVQHYGVQLLFRSKDVEYNEGWVLANKVVVALDGIDNAIITRNGTDYDIISVSRTAALTFIGVEPGTKKRNMFSANVLMTVKQIE